MPSRLALAQVVADPRLHGAEILADDDGAGAVCLQRDDADHRLVVVAHISSSCGEPFRIADAQPEQPDDVVDAGTAAGARTPALTRARNGS